MKLIRYREPQELWTPFDRLASVRDEFDRLFELPFSTLARQTGSFNDWAPAVDVHEEKDQIVVVAELPGMNREDIEISVHNGLLSISGERKSAKEDEGTETRRSERFYGRFSRTISLPTQINSTKVTASYKEGLLTVRLPKAEEAKPKQIQVTAE